jgi:TRAP-type C4-dicarboxylate transport system substrate-binding protein
MTRDVVIGGALAVMAIGAATPALGETTIRWLSQSQPISTQYPIETAAMERLEALPDVSVERSEFQSLGIDLGDGLRLIRSGTFDVISTQVGLVARDDAFLEGIDLIGVSTNVPELSDAVSAYRDVFNARLEDRFGVRALAIWPFGPQIMFCNQPIESVADLEGLKIRSFTASMSTLIEELGATPVTLSFPEVYPALQRGVASCGITSATSSNTGKWPEVTTHLIPLAVSGSVQAHLVNIDWWNTVPAETQKAIAAEFAQMESELWRLASNTNTDAIACSTGQDSCSRTAHTLYDMTLVEVSEADKARVKEIAEAAILPDWAERCERTYENCAAVWNETVGEARGLEIR